MSVRRPPLEFEDIVRRIECAAREIDALYLLADAARACTCSRVRAALLAFDRATAARENAK